MRFDEELLPALQQRRDADLYRRRLTLESPQGAEIVVDGRPCANFCSNDYLGLANHPDVVAAFAAAAQQYGVGSGASHLVCGHHREHHELEQALAEFTGRPRALLFSTGYMANLAVVTSLLGKADAVFQDKLNHASLLDAGLLSGARFQRFLHNDIDNLTLKLNRVASERKLIAVDGVFSMDGDSAPLAELAACAKQNEAWLMVDDAHGFGCAGSDGRGSVAEAQLNQDDVPIYMATLGKAVGTAGAFVAGSEALIETLVQFGRSSIYTTALPPAVAAATRTSLQVLQREAWRREHLQRLIITFKRSAEDIGLPLLPSASAIQPLMIGSASKAMELSATLRQAGILVTAIRPPTVASGQSRLRITLSAAHSEQQLDRLLGVLAESLP
ncbi:MAG: 8-amino-7-oxononanoate synthase [Pseudomonadales bacterium]